MTAQSSIRTLELGSEQRATAPVFVVGCPRSGTTLLYHMILSSGNFALYPSETHIFNILARRYGNLAVRKRREQMTDLWLNSKYFALTQLDREPIRTRLINDCRNAGDFLRIIMEKVAHSQKVERWAENTPEHILYLREIKALIPDAVFIHIVRDGRDVALSLDKLGWLPSLPWDRGSGRTACGVYWEWMVENGRKAGRSLGSDYMEVRYEDLLQHPHATLGSIGQFIDHDLDYERIQEVGVGTVRRPNTSFREKPEEDVFNPIGRWRGGFSPEQLVNFEKLVGPCLQNLGYALSTPEEDLKADARFRTLRAQYVLYFASRRWIKSHVPFANYCVDVSWFRE